MNWVELILTVGPLADEVAAVLATSDAVAAAGVEVRGEEVVMWAPAGEADAMAAALRAAVARLRASGLPVDPDAVRMGDPRPEDEWRDAWKRYFHVTRIGRRVVIVPSWERAGYTSKPGDLELDLDPGRAFGTGAHASTRLCLVELEQLCDQDGLSPRRFLDVGTGSGILAIAAVRLWPQITGEAFDVDPISVDAARENLEANGVAARVRVAEGSAADALPEPCELVLANIQAEILLALRPQLVRRVAPGGALVLAGLLAPEAEPVGAAFAEGGELVVSRITTLPEDRDWSSVVLRRPAGPDRP